MSRVLGIDLGTTKSVVGILEDGRPRILSSGSGGHSIPSLVMVAPDGNIYAGLKAARHPDRYNSKNITISSVKRMIGSKGETGWGWWKSYPQEVSAFILAELKQRAETLLQSKVHQAVIAIPSHFDEAQRRATKEAAKIAGIEVLRLLNEATAAILAYGFARKAHETVVVFDLGGGTLDVSIAEIEDGVFEVKTIEGESNLGGDDFTQAITNYVADQIRKEVGAEAADKAVRSLVLREAAERAKIDLSGGHSTTIYIPGFLASGLHHADLRVDITRDTFESLCKPLLDRAIGLLRKALQRSGTVKPNALLLLGGSSRIPILRRRVREELNIEPFTGVDPETCVAQGAIIQAGMLTGCLKDKLLLDVMPSSYGFSIKGGIFKAMIERDTIVPKKHSEIFTTTADNQATISIELFHGNGEMVSENNYVGHIELDGITPAPEGSPQIEVTFDVDANMLVRATAKDLGTGRKKEVTICSPFGLSEVQVNMMTKRLNHWAETRDILEQTHAIESRIAQLLSQSNLLDPKEVATLNNFSRQFSQAKQKTVQAEDIGAVLNAADMAVDNIAGVVRDRQNLLQTREGLTKRIHQLDSMALGEYSRECETLVHGIELLEEFKTRGATGPDLASLVSSIRWSYCDLISRQVVTLVREIYDSDDFKRIFPLLENEPISIVKQDLDRLSGLVACQPLRVLKTILAEDLEYADEICRRVDNSAVADPDFAAVWFLVCYECCWHPHLRCPKEPPADLDLAHRCIACLFGMLDTESSRSCRKSAAEALTLMIAPEEHFEQVVWMALKEPGPDIQACLLRHIDRAPAGVLIDWFRACDSDTKESIQRSVPILLRLCQSIESNYRDWALAALVDLNCAAAWNVLDGLMLYKDDMLRGAAYRAIFRANGRNPRANSVIRDSLNDKSVEIRLMGMDYVAANPTVVDVNTILQMFKADSSVEIRDKAVELLIQKYGEAGQLALLLVALEDGRQEIRGRVLDGVVAAKDGMDRDLARLLALILKRVETKKRLNMMERLFCRSLIKRRPATRSVVDLMIARR